MGGTWAMYMYQSFSNPWNSLWPQEFGLGKGIGKYMVVAE